MKPRLRVIAASRGVPFLHAHELVGKAVAQVIATKTPLDQLDLTALAARTNPGAPSISNITAEIAKWTATL